MGTLANQADIGVWGWVRFCRVWGYYPRKKLRLYMQHPAI